MAELRRWKGARDDIMNYRVDNLRSSRWSTRKRKQSRQQIITVMVLLVPSTQLRAEYPIMKQAIYTYLYIYKIPCNYYDPIIIYRH